MRMLADLDARTRTDLWRDTVLNPRVDGEELAGGIRVLYGGSAKPENIAGFLEKEDVDGALVGGASLKADSFAAMVKSAMA